MLLSREDDNVSYDFYARGEKNMGNIIVGAVVFLVIAGAAASIIRDKKNGKSCSCGCEGCSKCSGK
jgi:hypothetical protein